MLTDSGLGLSPEGQKRTINAFGIRLRKRGDFETAETFYRTALEVAPTDARIMFNLARTLHEKGDSAGCGQLLEQALAIDPDFAEAKAFLRWLRRHERRAVDDFPDITI